MAEEPSLQFAVAPGLVAASASNPRQVVIRWKDGLARAASSNLIEAGQAPDNFPSSDPCGPRSSTDKFSAVSEIDSLSHQLAITALILAFTTTPLNLSYWPLYPKGHACVFVEGLHSPTTFQVFVFSDGKAEEIGCGSMI
jgi:hypothetical protein